MPPTFHIRPMQEDDVRAVGHLHVAAWQAAYAGLMPQDFLQQLDPAAYHHRWAEGYARHHNDPACGTLLALHDDQLAGFLSYGPARDTGRADWHEIYAINIAPAHWGQGAGHALFRAARARLRNLGADETYLWVLQDNHRATAAYARWGGTVDPEQCKSIEIGGVSLPEISVRFRL